MRKLLFFVIASILFLVMLMLAASNEQTNIISIEPYYHNMYEESGESYEVALNNNTEVAVQFHATTSFNGFNIFFSGGLISRNPYLTVSLYEWNANYAKTIKGNPVFTQKYFINKRGIWLEVNTPETKKGEYLLVVNDAYGGLNAEVVLPATPNTMTYVDRTETYGSLMCTIKYINTPDKKLGAISENYREYNNTADTWVYTDGLGRKNPDYSKVRSKQKDKFVGIFYHTWHAKHSKVNSRNITEILKEHPEIKNNYSSPIWPKESTNYFWNEPLFGYYNNGVDRWVLRKHAEMLADAGVDVVIFDQTNGTDTFMEAIMTLLEVFAKARADGVKAPCITAMLPMFDYGNAAIQLREMYDKIYSKGLYKDLWFYWDGKPLMLTWPGNLNINNPKDKEIFEFFTYRPINPSYREDDAQALGPDGEITIKWSPPQGVREDYINWKWISIYPQAVAYRKDGTPEQMCVCIAQNWSKEQGITAMNAGDHVFGRSYSDKKGYDLSKDGKLYGANFAEQFEYALKVDPDFIFITGWNEWVAGRFQEMWGTENAFPDNFSDNYSRDIEPSKGDLKDHYYYQMVTYIRRFKGTDGFQRSSGKKKIDIYSDSDQWHDVKPWFHAYEGNTFAREYDGYKGFSYFNDTGRNDIIGAKVAYDDNNIYFMVETRDDLTSHTDKAWMRLFIDVNDSKDNWETFEYVINRINPSDKKAYLERSTGGYNWELVGEVDYAAKGNRLQIAVPKKLLGIKGDKFEFNFKWVDNTQEEGDVMDFYISGDTAPLGRFKYRFVSASQGKWLDFKNSPFPIIIIASLSLILLFSFVFFVWKIRLRKNINRGDTNERN